MGTVLIDNHPQIILMLKREPEDEEIRMRIERARFDSAQGGSDARNRAAFRSPGEKRPGFEALDPNLFTFRGDKSRGKNPPAIHLYRLLMNLNSPYTLNKKILEETPV
jgi:hypothetical protein